MAKTTDQSQTPSRPNGAENKRRNILVVDDDRDLREVMWRFLAAHGWRVQTAGDGMTALDVLERERFDAVLADERAPGLAGIRLLSYVQYTSPGARLILFSGYPSSWSREIARDIGAHVITKGTADSLRELLEVLNG